MKTILGAALFAGMVGFAMPVMAQQSQPSCDWDCNYTFKGFYDLRDQAVIIDMRESRGFGTSVNSTSTSTQSIICEAGEGGKAGGCSAFEEFTNKNEVNTIGSQEVIDQSNSQTVNVGDDSSANVGSQDNTSGSGSTNSGAVNGSATQNYKDSPVTTNNAFGSAVKSD